MTASRAFIQLMLPSKVLISPLWPRVLPNTTNIRVIIVSASVHNTCRAGRPVQQMLFEHSCRTRVVFFRWYLVIDLSCHISACLRFSTMKVSLFPDRRKQYSMHTLNISNKTLHHKATCLSIRGATARVHAFKDRECIIKK